MLQATAENTIKTISTGHTDVTKSSACFEA